jgi:TolB-like protein/DNA-binding winged helix-turn-helix (wHTH) protein
VGVGIFQFGEFELDCERFELFRAGRGLKVERMPMELLILLVARNGQLVSRAEIAERLWSREVFVDTEHGINSTIRKIRQALRDDPDQPRFLQTVTGKGYRCIAPVARIGGAAGGNGVAPSSDRVTKLPAADGESSLSATLAPVAAADPILSSIATKEPLETVRLPSSRRRSWIASLAAALAIALVLVIAFRVHTRGGRTDSAIHPQISSLAVLPLDNLSGDPAQEYFADGLTDELITMLAKDSNLRIVSRTSVMQYKGAHRPLREVAHELGVDGILEGSVERGNGKVHMTIQLIHGPSDTHVWAESYDRDANDVVTLPSEAAQTIAKRLHSTVPPSAPARYVNPDAHDAYLHGRYLWFQDQNEKAAEYFKKATELQPDYAEGWAGLSDYYGVGTIEGKFDPRTALPAMDAAARKAVALDDSLPWAHVSLAATYWCYNWDLARADQEIQRAIDLDPKLAEA